MQPRLSGLHEQEERHIDAQLRELEDRLVDHYGGGDDQRVRRVRSVVAAAIARFADARVRKFVPILVERAARVELSV